MSCGYAKSTAVPTKFVWRFHFEVVLKMPPMVMSCFVFVGYLMHFLLIQQTLCCVLWICVSGYIFESRDRQLMGCIWPDYAIDWFNVWTDMCIICFMIMYVTMDWWQLCATSNAKYDKIVYALHVFVETIGHWF